MGTITALTKQKRNPNRVNVYLDGEFAFGLAAMTAVSLKVGQELTPTHVETLRQSDELENAKQSAIHFLGFRPRSVAEVRDNLRNKGFDEAVIEQAVERLQELELLNDAEFARYWVEQRETFKPRSQMVLRRELQQKGVGREIIDESFIDVDDTSAARQAARKQAVRWQNLAEDEFKSKLSGFLQRRGFTFDVIKEISNETWQFVSSNNE